MKHLTLDIENTVVKRNGKLHLDPFEPENTLVQVGMLDDLGNESIITFDVIVTGKPQCFLCRG